MVLQSKIKDIIDFKSLSNNKSANSKAIVKITLYAYLNCFHEIKVENVKIHDIQIQAFVQNKTIEYNNIMISNNSLFNFSQLIIHHMAEMRFNCAKVADGENKSLLHWSPNDLMLASGH